MARPIKRSVARPVATRTASPSSIARAVAPHLVEAVEVVDDRPEDGDEGEEPVSRSRRGDALGDRNDLGVGSAAQYAAARAASVAARSEARKSTAMRRVDLLDHRQALLAPRLSALFPATLDLARETPRAKRSRANGSADSRSGSVIEARRGRLARPRRRGPPASSGRVEDAVDAVAHDVARASAPRARRPGRRRRAPRRPRCRSPPRPAGRTARRSGRARAAPRGRRSDDDSVRREPRGRGGGFSSGPLPDEDERAAEPARGLDRVVVALVGHERADGEQEVLAARRSGPWKKSTSTGG